MVSDNSNIAFKKLNLKRTNQRPKLLDEVRAHLRVNHYSKKTEEAYIGWINRFIINNK